MAEKRNKRVSSIATRVAAIACASVLVVGCVGYIGYGFASAEGDAAAPDGTFGLSTLSSSTTDASPFVANSNSSLLRETTVRETTVLASATQRDISKGIEAIEAEEEAKRIAEEEAKRAEEQARIAAAEEAKAAQQAAAAAESSASALASLSDVDWSVGQEAFVAEWTARIDAYLAGSPLAGQGATFAMAAWSNGVDPRWSPAISNTESSKGAACFRPCNAWGWGQSGWSSWEEAINAHVAGLASGYGYSITVAAAQKYCPPTYMDWFNKTLAQMKMI